jgi:hypothetical protein
MTSKLISKKIKTQLFMTLIGSIVCYGCETWTLSVRDIRSLLVFGRQSSGMIYGSDQTEQGQRIETNDELAKLMTRERAVI